MHIPTTDGRKLVLTRYTEPEPELKLLLDKLRLDLPSQPPPKITAEVPRSPTIVVPTCRVPTYIHQSPSEVGEDPCFEFKLGSDADVAEQGPSHLGEETFYEIEP